MWLLTVPLEEREFHDLELGLPELAQFVGKEHPIDRFIGVADIYLIIKPCRLCTHLTHFP
jgi:hypothetical protein